MLDRRRWATVAFEFDEEPRGGQRKDTAMGEGWID
jgi:hypothetical protein